MSYLNLDWKPIPVIPKFVDIVVNGMSEKIYDIKAYAQDPESLKQRTNYAQNILMDIETKDFIENVNANALLEGIKNDQKRLIEKKEIKSVLESSEAEVFTFLGAGDIGKEITKLKSELTIL